MELHFPEIKGKLEDYISPENPDFVDNFNQLIEDSHRRWLEKIKNKPNFPNEEPEEVVKKKKVKKPMENIFKEPPPWKPSNGYGGEFDKLKILKHENQLNNWELLRVNNLSKRSYYKQAIELPKGEKHFIYSNSYGKEFKDLKEGEGLAKSDEKIVKSLISDYKSSVSKGVKFDEEVYKYKHSKPKVEYNDWKYINRVGDYFHQYQADKIHSFKQQVKKGMSDKKPFLRPSEYGDYFNKIDLSMEYDKFTK